MRQAQRIASALMLGGALAFGVVAGAGCKSAAESQGQPQMMATYKCAMASCGKTKQAGMGDPAPSC